MKLSRCYTAIANFFSDQSGPTGVEYAVMLALITTAVIGSVTLVGGATMGHFDHAVNVIGEAFGR